MFSISYTLNPTIADNLSRIEYLRKTILVTPLSPFAESKLRWQAIRDHIHATLRLSGKLLSKSELVPTLTTPPKKLSEEQEFATALKQALDVIAESWTANQKPLTPAAIEALAQIALPIPARTLNRQIIDSTLDIKNLLKYLDSPKDHPVITAAIAHGQLSFTPLSRENGHLLSRLIGRLMLAKYGYDCRGWIAPEPYWLEDQELHKKALQSIEQFGNLTVWLEHYTKAIRTCFERLALSVEKFSQGMISDSATISHWNLNDRQQNILRLLTHPTAKITNRDIQKHYRISPITASRDLTRLVGLGLLYSHGKGRSVYYTRA